MSRRVKIFGVLAAATYILVAVGGARVTQFPQRTLADGTQTVPPYRWASPPPDFAKGNQQPSGGTGHLLFTAKGSQQQTVSTTDGQFLAVFPEGAFKRRAKEKFIDVSIAPLDPATLGDPPSGQPSLSGDVGEKMQYDGNAYTLTAVYGATKKPAALVSRSCTGAQKKLCPLVAIRYAIAATAVYRRANGSWVALDDITPSPGSLQLFGPTANLGTFVATAPVGAKPQAGGSGFSGYAIALIGTGAIAAGLGVSRRPRVQRWWRRLRGKKAPPPPRRKKR
ncbi:MAG: hypothetical protein ABR552_00265 [Actinomycetota bacterium]